MARRNLLPLALFLLAVSAFVGCRFGDYDGVGPVSPNTLATTVAPAAARGSVTFNVQLPGLQHHSARAAMRATNPSSKAAAQVTFVLQGIQISNPDSPRAAAKTKTVTVSEDGTASATFDNVSELPTIGRIKIENAVWNGVTDLQGAKDILPGANVLTVNPTGSGLTSEVSANVLDQIADQKTAVQALKTGGQTSGVVDRIRTSLRGFDLQDPTARNTAVNSVMTTLLQTVNNSALTYLSFNRDRTQLSGNVQGANVWTQINSDFWTNDAIGNATLDLSQMLVDGVMRQGLDGFGYVAWRHAVESPFAITKVGTATGSRNFVCLVDGFVNQSVAMPDGSIIAGGYNATRHCPSLIRWAGTGNANTTRAAGDKAGLAWENLFADFAANASWTQPAVESISYDGASALTVTVRDPNLGLPVPFRLDVNNGQGTKTFGTGVYFAVQIGAAAQQISLAWNPIKDATEYRIYRSTTGAVSATTANKVGTVSSPSFVQTGLTNGTRYYYVVTALINGTESAPSGVVSAVPEAAAEAPKAPNTPTIAVPAANATAQALNPTLTASNFSDLNTGDAWKKAEFEIYTTSAANAAAMVWAGSVVTPATGTAPAAASIEVSAANGKFVGTRLGHFRLGGDTTYYARVRYFDNARLPSEWSALSGFSTAVEPNAPPATPFVLFPSVAQAHAEVNLVIKTSEFRDANAGDAMAGIDAEVATDNLFTSTSVVWSGSVNAATTTIKVDTTNGQFKNALSTKTKLNANATYFLHVRHRDNKGTSSSTSAWSSAVTFRSSFDPSLIRTPAFTTDANRYDLLTMSPKASTAVAGEFSISLSSFGAGEVAVSVDGSSVGSLWSLQETAGASMATAIPPSTNFWLAPWQILRTGSWLWMRTKNDDTFLIELISATSQLVQLRVRYVPFSRRTDRLYAGNCYRGNQGTVTNVPTAIDFENLSLREFANGVTTPAEITSSQFGYGGSWSWGGGIVALWTGPNDSSTSSSRGYYVFQRVLTTGTSSIPLSNWAGQNDVSTPPSGWSSAGGLQANSSYLVWRHYLDGSFSRDDFTLIRPTTVTRCDAELLRPERLPVPAWPASGYYLHSDFATAFNFATLARVNPSGDNYDFKIVGGEWVLNTLRSIEVVDLGGADFATVAPPTDGWAQSLTITPLADHVYMFRQTDSNTSNLTFVVVKVVSIGARDLFIQVRKIQ